MFDKYDFDLDYQGYYKNFEATVANNGAVYLQTKGDLENYYTLIPVISEMYGGFYASLYGSYLFLFIFWYVEDKIKQFVKNRAKN